MHQMKFMEFGTQNFESGTNNECTLQNLILGII